MPVEHVIYVCPNNCCPRHGQEFSWLAASAHRALYGAPIRCIECGKIVRKVRELPFSVDPTKGKETIQ